MTHIIKCGSTVVAVFYDRELATKFLKRLAPGCGARIEKGPGKRNAYRGKYWSKAPRERKLFVTRSGHARFMEASHFSL